MTLIQFYILIFFIFFNFSNQIKKDVIITRKIEKKNSIQNDVYEKIIMNSISDISKYFLLNDNVKLYNENSDNILRLSFEKRFDNPSIISKFDIKFGKIEADIKASDGIGIISSFYLQAKNLDEIDIAELFGAHQFDFETNFFLSKDLTGNKDVEYHYITHPQKSFNRYGVEWSFDKILWTINGNVIRQVMKSDIKQIPQSKMAVKISLWDGGEVTNKEGTDLWAGGRTDYSKTPFIMEIKKFSIIDFGSKKNYLI